jgi:hypothetical protein
VGPNVPRVKNKKEYLFPTKTGIQSAKLIPNASAKYNLSSRIQDDAAADCPGSAAFIRRIIADLFAKASIGKTPVSTVMISPAVCRSALESFRGGEPWQKPHLFQ